MLYTVRERKGNGRTIRERLRGGHDLRREDEGHVDAVEERAGLSRSDVLKGVVLAAGAASAPATLAVLRPESGSAAASPARDRQILNFLLLLEYVQEGLYGHGVRSGSLTGELARLANVAGEQERAHVAALERALGASARPRPALRFGSVGSDPDRFARAALELEETAAAAYIGQGANLTAGAIADVAGIVSVEARHAAWLRDLAGRLPAPRAADRAQSADVVTARLKEVGYVVE